MVPIWWDLSLLDIETETFILYINVMDLIINLCAQEKKKITFWDFRSSITLKALVASNQLPSGLFYLLLLHYRGRFKSCNQRVLFEFDTED